MNRAGSPKTWPRDQRSARVRTRTLLAAEVLEIRSLLSIANAATSTALDTITATPAVELSAQPLVTNLVAAGATPAQIRAAYGFNGIKGDGTGQTIAIIDAYNAPTLAMDLAGFDHHFGLALASLTQVNQSGGSVLPQTDAGWALET